MRTSRFSCKGINYIKNDSESKGGRGNFDEYDFR
jgi:hypothetical protein